MHSFANGTKAKQPENFHEKRKGKKICHCVITATSVLSLATFVSS